MTKANELAYLNGLYNIQQSKQGKAEKPSPEVSVCIDVITGRDIITK
jgi:hypothetical protein